MLKATVCGCGRWLYHCQPYQPATERPPTTKSSTRAARGRMINHCNQGGGCQERRPRSREHALAKPRRIKRAGASKDCLFMTSSWGGGASAPVQVAGRCAYRPWPEVRSMSVLPWIAARRRRPPSGRAFLAKRSSPHADDKGLAVRRAPVDHDFP